MPSLTGKAAPRNAAQDRWGPPICTAPGGHAPQRAQGSGRRKAFAWFMCQAQPSKVNRFCRGSQRRGKTAADPEERGEGEKESGAVPRALQTNLAAASQMKEQRPARGLRFLGINQEPLKPNQGHPAGTGRRRITPSWSRTTALGPRTHCPHPRREQLSRMAVWPRCWRRCKPPVPSLLGFGEPSSCSHPWEASREAPPAFVSSSQPHQGSLDIQHRARMPGKGKGRLSQEETSGDKDRDSLTAR